MENKKITFKQTEASWLDAEYIDELLMENDAAIMGNCKFRNILYLHLTDADAQELEYYTSGNNYVNIDEFIQELSNKTGAAYTYKYIRGYTQAEWQALIYKKNTLTEQEIKIIECLYFGKYTAFITDEETPAGNYFIALECEYNNIDELKKILADQSLIDAKNIKIASITGYKQEPIYTIE